MKEFVQLNLFDEDFVNKVKIICNSNCIYSFSGFCKKDSVLMLWTNNENGSSNVICDDYVSSYSEIK